MTLLLKALLFVSILSQQEDPTKQARELVDKLRSDKADERDDATRKLKQLGKSVVPELEKAAKDKDPEVASRAQVLLAFFDLERSIPERLKKTIPDVTDRLASGGDHAWTEVFLAVASKDVELEALAPRAVRGARTPSERSEVFRLVSRKGLRSAIPELVARLEEDGKADFFFLQGDAVQALLVLKANEAAPVLMKLLNHSNASVRARAAALLGKLGASGAAKDLSTLLKDEDPVVRHWAVNSLTEIGAADAVPELRKLLHDREPKVRMMAVLAMAALGVQDAVPEIRTLLMDKEPSIRWTSASCLGALRGKEAVPDLVKLLGDQDTQVVKIAAEILVELAPKEAAGNIRKLLKEERGEVRAEAVELMARLGEKENVRDLVPLLKDAQYVVRLAAATAISRLGSREGVSTLLEAATEDSGAEIEILNALRQPEVWRGLRDKKSQWNGKTKSTTIRELLEKLTGMTVEADENLQISISGDEIKRKCSVLDDVQRVLSGERQFVLEKDRIRVLSRDEAVKFWLTWWSGQEKK